MINFVIHVLNITNGVNIAYTVLPVAYCLWPHEPSKQFGLSQTATEETMVLWDGRRACGSGRRAGARQRALPLGEAWGPYHSGPVL